MTDAEDALRIVPRFAVSAGGASARRSGRLSAQRSTTISTVIGNHATIPVKEPPPETCARVDDGVTGGCRSPVRVYLPVLSNVGGGACCSCPIYSGAVNFKDITVRAATCVDDDIAVVDNFHPRPC